MPVDLELAERIVKLLNEMMELDTAAVAELMAKRVVVNDRLADHPTVQVGPMEPDGPNVMGILGVLNGLVGTNSRGWGCVAGVYEDASLLNLLRFKVLGDRAVEEQSQQ
jgi:hypothetical protein